MISLVLVYMSIRLFRDKGCRIEYYPKAASEAFAVDDLVVINSSGYLTRAADGSAQRIVGLVQKTVASTDSDYASNTRIPVLVCDSDAEYLCDVTTGTAAQTDVGEYIDIDDHNSVDVVASTYDVFFVTDFISTTQVIAKINTKAAVAGS